MTDDERAAWARALISDWPPPPREAVEIYARSLLALAEDDTRLATPARRAA